VLCFLIDSVILNSSFILRFLNFTVIISFSYAQIPHRNSCYVPHTLDVDEFRKQSILFLPHLLFAFINTKLQTIIVSKCFTLFFPKSHVLVIWGNIVLFNQNVTGSNSLSFKTGWMIQNKAIHALLINSNHKPIFSTTICFVCVQTMNWLEKKIFKRNSSDTQSWNGPSFYIYKFLIKIKA